MNLSISISNIFMKIVPVCSVYQNSTLKQEVIFHTNELRLHLQKTFFKESVGCQENMANHQEILAIFKQKILECAN